MKSIIFHIDVNSAFLSWTALELLKKGHHDIRMCYAVIGHAHAKRGGMVLARSEICKKVGITSAMPMYMAKRKVKKLEIYPPNYEWYQTMSSSFVLFLKQYTPDVEVVSIDECYLDYTGIAYRYGDAYEFACKLKEEIYKQLGFTVNIGIGNNKLCAKIAGDFSKPNKVHTLWLDEIETKLWPLPIESLLGIGRRTSAFLRELGISKIYDLAHFDLERLKKRFKNQAERLIQTAKGFGSTKVDGSEHESKGISASITLPFDQSDPLELFDVLYFLTEKVARGLRKQEKYASVIAVTIRDGSFHTSSHQSKLLNPTSITLEIYEVVKQLFKKLWNGSPVRLLGVRLDQLTMVRQYQTSLFENVEEKEKEEKIDLIMDDLNVRFGKGKLQRASLYSYKK